jgi:hypothetical protein
MTLEGLVQVTRSVGILAMIGTIAIGASACSKSKSSTPSETQTAGDVRTPNAPMTVTGCLRAGKLADTYVLTQDAANTGAQETANYQLVGVDGVDLRKYIGERVQVDGVLASQQELESRSTPAPARQADKGKEKPTGTAGKPTVQTETEVDMRTLQVKSVNPQGGKCEMK